jgi:hypothetical protein
LEQINDLEQMSGASSDQMHFLVLSQTGPSFGVCAERRALVCGEAVSESAQVHRPRYGIGVVPEVGLPEEFPQMFRDETVFRLPTKAAG